MTTIAGLMSLFGFGAAGRIFTRGQRKMCARHTVAQGLNAGCTHRCSVNIGSMHWCLSLDERVCGEGGRNGLSPVQI